MFVKNIGEIKAIAFDIDGTLYSERKLYRRMLGEILRNFSFFYNFFRIRKTLHRKGFVGSFYEMQSRMMAQRLRCGEKEAGEKIRSIVYDGLKPHFEKIRCFKDVVETFRLFKQAGLKLALLSDFPPEQKGNIWGCASYCDVIMCSEEAGALKPAKEPFLLLSKRLKVKAEEILYVGNSVKFDVSGARRSGLKSALFLPFFHFLFQVFSKKADIHFYSYRQLQRIVLECPKFH